LAKLDIHNQTLTVVVLPNNDRKQNEEITLQAARCHHTR
jgi:hypothetical protein